MLKPKILKCHEDLITLETYRYVQLGKTIDNKFFNCENSNIFGYLGAQGGGGSDFIHILVHIYPIFNINNNLMSNIEAN